MRELRGHTANRIRRHLRKLRVSRGGGFYGLVAVLTFLYLEIIDVAGDVAGMPAAEIDPGFLISFVIGNLVDPLVNGIRAAIWPIAWIGRFGVGLLSAGLLAGSYLVYRAIRPAVIRLLTPTDETQRARIATDSPPG